MIKKIGDDNCYLTSNMKKVKILSWCELSEKDRDKFWNVRDFTESCKEYAETNQYFKIWGRVYSLDDLGNASGEKIEKYILDSTNCDMVLFLNIGYHVLGAIGINNDCLENNYIIYGISYKQLITDYSY